MWSTGILGTNVTYYRLNIHKSSEDIQKTLRNPLKNLKKVELGRWWTLLSDEILRANTLLAQQSQKVRGDPREPLKIFKIS